CGALRALFRCARRRAGRCAARCVFQIPHDLQDELRMGRAEQPDRARARRARHPARAEKPHPHLYRHAAGGYTDCGFAKSTGQPAMTDNAPKIAFNPEAVARLYDDIADVYASYYTDY